MIFTKDFKIIKSSRVSKEEKVRNIFYPHKLYLVAGLSKSWVMNSRPGFGTHTKVTSFLRAGASRDILKIRFLEMAFPGLFKMYFLPWTPCCFV